MQNIQGNAVKRAAELLSSCGTPGAIMQPSTLFNEGWMLRLTLDWFDQHRGAKHPLAFLEDSRWFSEAMLRSQFLARHRGDVLAESWTFADGAIGHFGVGKSGIGDLHLLPDARQLVIVEAKMFSGLSASTTRARHFDQAARNVACIAETLCEAGRHPRDLDRLAFFVVAPQQQIDRGIFGGLLTKQSLEAKVRDRVAAYEGAKDEWFETWFLPTLEKIRVAEMSWQSIVSAIGKTDANAATDLDAFLQACLSLRMPIVL